MGQNETQRLPQFGAPVEHLRTTRIGISSPWPLAPGTWNQTPLWPGPICSLHASVSLHPSLGALVSGKGWEHPTNGLGFRDSNYLLLHLFLGGLVQA